MTKKSYAKHEGVKHIHLGNGLVIDPNPDSAGKIYIKFKNGQSLWIHSTELEPVPTDINHRIIKIGDFIIYPLKMGRYNPAAIGQGVVETIKMGKSPKYYNKGVDIVRVGVREDRTGMVKSITNYRQCVVIDSKIILGDIDNPRLTF